MRYNKTLTK